MKTKPAILIATVLSVALGASYWLTCSDQRNSRPSRINRVRDLKQISLTFRGGRNELNPQSVFGGYPLSLNIRAEDR